MKCKIEKELFDSLYSQGLNDPAIAKSLGVSVSTVLRFRKMHNYPANKIQHISQRAKAIEIKQEVREILCGTLLGDSSLQYMSIKSISPLFSSYHGPQQEEYVKHLTEILKDFNPNCKKRERFDKRTQKTYIS